MSVQVSTSDLLGTAMSAAKVAAMELEMVRERTENGSQRRLPIDRAVSELVQALAETLVAEAYVDDIRTRDHEFGASCAEAEGIINRAVNEIRASV